MAITSRAKRDTAIAYKHLPEFLGPGSYDPAFMKKPLCGQAPFGSTSQRDQYSTKSISTPGPGSYQSPPDEDSQKKPFSVFASKSLRMLNEADLAKKAQAPGPGAYTVPGNPWLKPGGSGMHEPTIPTAVNWVKVSSAPSIPTIAQSYGYEQGPHGALVQQKAPMMTFAGNEKDSVGPGSYEMDSKLLLKMRAPTFSKGKAERDCFNIPKEMFARPGPGQYGAAAASTDEVVRPSSVFMSATTRDKLSTKNAKDKAPGPGYYEQPKLWKTKQEMAALMPESLQAFGSTSRKLFKPAIQQHPPLLNNLETPGPGSYDAVTKAPESRQRLVVLGDSEAPHGAFDSTAPRFSPTKEMVAYTPGPGYYLSDKDGVASSVQRRLSGKYGVFGSTSQRFPQPKQDDNLGPGAYDDTLNLGSDLAKPRRKDPRSAVFASRMNRDKSLERPQDRSVPPVGSYSVPPPDWVKKSVNCGKSVLPTAPRFKLSKLSDAPGPGAYEPDPIADENEAPKKPKSSVVLDSKTLRFPADGKDSVPGPGYYDPSSTLLKKTFNVTIGEK